MSKNTKKNSSLKKEILDPLIGLELTFSNSNTVGDIGNNGLKNTKAAGRYTDFLKGAEGAFKNFKLKSEAEDCEVKIERTEIGKILESGSSIMDLKDLKISFVSEKDGEKFWINITRDPCVIEIQTMPVAVSILRDKESIPSQVLDKVFLEFSIGGSVKYSGSILSSSKQGGGHINIDAKTSQLDNLGNVLELIKEWEEVKGGEGCLVEPESQSAARMADSRYYRDDKKWLDEAKNRSGELLDAIEKSLGKKPEEAFRSVLKAYWSYPQSTIVSNNSSDSGKIYLGSKQCKESDRRICMHNQAINIEHLFDADEKTRRVEFREFRAQKSREEVLECYEIIEKVLFKIPNIQSKFDRLFPSSSCGIIKTSALKLGRVISNQKISEEKCL